jgi:hypothetical protein
MYNYKVVNEPTESIYRYMRCPKCLKSLVHAEHKNYGKSIRDVQDLDFGFTHTGFQVWCNVHEINVIHINKLGMDLPVDTSVYGTLDDRNQGRVQPMSSLKQQLYEQEN